MKNKEENVALLKKNLNILTITPIYLMPEAPGEYWKTPWEDRTHEGQHQRIATFITALRTLLEDPTHNWSVNIIEQTLSIPGLPEVFQSRDIIQLDTYHQEHLKDY